MIPEMVAIGVASGLFSGTALGMAALETVRLGRVVSDVATALDTAFGATAEQPLPADQLALLAKLEGPANAAR